MEPFPYLSALEGRDWPRRVIAILVWLGIVESAQGLIAVLHAGPTTSLILTIAGVMIAFVAADRVAGVAIVPAPGLLASLGIGLVVGMLCGHAVADRYGFGATAAEICMIAGAVAGESVVVMIYRAIRSAMAMQPPSTVMLRTAQR